MELWQAERDQFDVVNSGREKDGNVGLQRHSSVTKSLDGDSFDEEPVATH
jgi:hypothetical protein